GKSLVINKSLIENSKTNIEKTSKISIASLKKELLRSIELK
ncbi:uncharacterized protein METZ01_LOCUS128115, partial [marine metagenome]